MKTTSLSFSCYFFPGENISDQLFVKAAYNVSVSTVFCRSHVSGDLSSTLNDLSQ